MTERLNFPTLPHRTREEWATAASKMGKRKLSPKGALNHDSRNRVGVRRRAREKQDRLRARLRLDDFAVAEAGGADADALALSGHFGVHRAQVDVPAPLGDVVGVADAVARLRLLAANFALL